MSANAAASKAAMMMMMIAGTSTVERRSADFSVTCSSSIDYLKKMTSHARSGKYNSAHLERLNEPYI